jgi:hypothetical protein
VGRDFTRKGTSPRISAAVINSLLCSTTYNLTHQWPTADLFIPCPPYLVLAYYITMSLPSLLMLRRGRPRRVHHGPRIPPQTTCQVLRIAIKTHCRITEIGLWDLNGDEEALGVGVGSCRWSGQGPWSRCILAAGSSYLELGGRI